MAVYIGSFDPFHNGHLEIVQLALKYVPKVIIIVSINKKKTNQMPLLLRYQMAKYLFENNSNIEVSIDITKYTTNEYYGIIGSDVINTPKWNPKNWIFVIRPGFGNKLPLWLDTDAIIINQNLELSSTFVRQHFDLTNVPYRIYQILNKINIYSDKLQILINNNEKLLCFDGNNYIKIYQKGFYDFRNKIPDHFGTKWDRNEPEGREFLAKKEYQYLIELNVIECALIGNILLIPNLGNSLYELILDNNFPSTNVYYEIGLLVRKMHMQYQLYHGDVSTKNLIIKEDSVYVIDFEHSLSFIDPFFDPKFFAKDRQQFIFHLFLTFSESFRSKFVTNSMNILGQNGTLGRNESEHSALNLKTYEINYLKLAIKEYFRGLDVLLTKDDKFYAQHWFNKLKSNISNDLMNIFNDIYFEITEHHLYEK